MDRGSTLAGRERKVPERIVRGFTFSEIGELLGISADTVAADLLRICRELEVRSCGEAVCETLQRGLVALES